MYPIDRRKVAIHMYSILSSLRKVSILLNTSHSTIHRWLKNPERKKYTRNQETKYACASRTPGDEAWLLFDHGIDEAKEYASRRNEIVEGDKGDLTVIYTTC